MNEKDIENCKELIRELADYKTNKIEDSLSISKVLSELETKDKIIDCMANKFYELYKIYPRNNRQIF